MEANPRRHLGQSWPSTTIGIRPKPVDYRIEKQPFNACVLRHGVSPFAGMRRSGGGTQRVVISEEAREPLQIRAMAAVLQQASPVAVHQVLASKNTASFSLAVELLSYRLPRPAQE